MKRDGKNRFRSIAMGRVAERLQERQALVRRGGAGRAEQLNPSGGGCTCALDPRRRQVVARSPGPT